MKRTQKKTGSPGSKRLLLTGAAALGLVAVVMVLWLGFRTNRSLGNDLPGKMRELGDATDPRIVAVDGWFTHSFAMSNGGENDRYIRDRWHTLKGQLGAYRKIPELADLVEIFDSSVPAALTAIRRTDGNITKVDFGLVNTQDADVEIRDIQGDRLKILFYGKLQMGEMKEWVSGSKICFNHLLHAVLFPAQYPESSQQDAFVFHELKHVKQYRAWSRFGGRNPVTREANDRLTDMGAGWEIEAHQTVRAVFDFKTQGEYGKRILTVMRSKRASNPTNLMLKLTSEDVRFIDQIFPPPLWWENGYRKYQYFVDLGREWINQHISEPDRQNAMKSFIQELDAAQPKY
jgi:hypothetical protein